MSEALRIALVAEGPTDRVVIEAALRSMLTPRPFVLTQLHPEGSLAFGPTGTGWVGVCRWCRNAVERGNGRLVNDELLFQQWDLLILHLDADVAGSSYDDGSLTPTAAEAPLPCERACPPAAATTDELRHALLSWCRESAPPPRTVLCTPSKSTEAWVVAALFPDDGAMAGGIECWPNPEARLAQQPKARRIHKTLRDYQARQADIEQAWPRLSAPGALTEARRFEAELRAALPQ